MAKNNEIVYPFGESLFIGIVKFFDNSKGYDYLASNNYGMESHKRFNSSEQRLYRDMLDKICQCRNRNRRGNIPSPFQQGIYN